MQLILASPSGLVISDFSFALYLNGTAISTSGLSVSELASLGVGSEYLVSGLPDAEPGEQYILTWNDGISAGSRRYPVLPAVPPNIIIPIRQSGFTLSSIGARLFLDATLLAPTHADVLALTLTELGNADYRLAGLKNPAPGSFYTFSYLVGPALYLETWPQPIAGINVALPDASSFVAGFLDEMPDILLAQRGTKTGSGTFIPSGAVAAFPCRISGGPQLTRDIAGQEATSTVQILIGGVGNLNARDYRYTLPARFSPRTNLVALQGHQWTDEDGPCYEKVWLP
mgnify:CR=1 FL=1